MINSIIDARIPQPTVTNQLLVWNNTTGLFEASVSLSGLTLNSPVISGAFSWTGVGSTLDASDSAKIVSISPTQEFVFGVGINQWLALSPADTNIRFGNSTDNPAFNFLGTGLASFGGNIDVTGKILANGGFIGDTDDDELIAIDGAGGIVTVHGSAQLGDAVTDIHGINTAPVVGQMLTTLVTFDTANTEATGIHHTLNFNQDVSSGDYENFGMLVDCNIGGTLSGSGGRDDKEVTGMDFQMSDDKTYSGTATGSRTIGLNLAYANGGSTYTVDPLLEEVYGLKVEINGSLSSIGTKYGMYCNVTGSGANNYGGWFRADLATNNYGIWVDAGKSVFKDDISILSNTKKFYLGDSQQSSIQYDGTNLIINPKEVGTGVLSVLGDTVSTGDVSGATLTAGDGFSSVGTLQAYTTFTIVNGIITNAV